MPVSSMWHACHAYNHAPMRILLGDRGHSFATVQSKVINFCFGIKFELLDEGNIRGPSILSRTSMQISGMRFFYVNIKPPYMYVCMCMCVLMMKKNILDI